MLRFIASRDIKVLRTFLLPGPKIYTSWVHNHVLTFGKKERCNVYTEHVSHILLATFSTVNGMSQEKTSNI